MSLKEHVGRNLSLAQCSDVGLPWQALKASPSFLVLPWIQQGRELQASTRRGSLSSHWLCRGGWKHHSASPRGRDWELGRENNGAFFSFLRLESPTHVCLIWWKAEFPGVSFSQLPHMQHKTLSHGSSSPWASHSLKTGTAAQWSLQKVASFWPSADWWAEECYLAVSQTDLLQHSQFIETAF